MESYIAIDLKSFYASVECVARGLDPMTTNLVVADVSRTEKTICLAVSPALKAYGVPGRARLFEVMERVAAVNAARKSRAPGKKLTGESYDAPELAAHPELALGYIAAPPRMAHYVECSTQIYNIYLKYIAPEDIHVYSIDEVFIDATRYLKLYGMTARELARKLIAEVLEHTGITATAGVATNLYLCKVAMDIMAKRVEPDANGVRIAELDERRYREQLWDHRPLTDFWRLGRGYAKKLAQHGLYTMGDVARCSLSNEDLLYKLFGVGAELLIDHAWGWEPCTIAEIKAYKPETHSVSSGQVLTRPYAHEEARLIVREMADLLSLDLARKGLITDQLVLTLGYDRENLQNGGQNYRGAVTTDYYGRMIPKHAHGTESLPRASASTKAIVGTAMALFDRIADPALTVRRVTIVANHTRPALEETGQLDFFAGDADLEREKRMQRALLDIQKKYGKNAIVKGMNLKEGATTMLRNEQIGGHKK